MASIGDCPQKAARLGAYQRSCARHDRTRRSQRCSHLSRYAGSFIRAEIIDASCQPGWPVSLEEGFGIFIQSAVCTLGKPDLIALESNDDLLVPMPAASIPQAIFLQRACLRM